MIRKRAFESMRPGTRTATWPAISTPQNAVTSPKGSHTANATRLFALQRLVDTPLATRLTAASRSPQLIDAPSMISAFSVGRACAFADSTSGNEDGLVLGIIAGSRPTMTQRRGLRTGGKGDTFLSAVTLGG